ncbi:D-cysteine desulfhydrase family protein [Teredinibacter franksiae]|uniref:D-cysteine desulfhydrase family protein n=1 Tax=Teredinibacter franksiae TaxID=2761453 RepID=UPI00162A57D7|nr:D-cysteine desulfhydrase family protein [Teredinibacter franksiae]
MLSYQPPRISLANLPTPFRPLDRISEILGGPRIWIKQDDCTGSANSGNKLRKLEFVIADALEQGCDTLITCGGVQSNHCRATALAGAQLGLKVHLLLRGDDEVAVDGNLLLDRLANAEISMYPSSEFVPNLNSLFQYWQAHYQNIGRKAYCIPMGASDEVGLWGYLQAAQELQADFDRHKLSPGGVVTATGSGGTQAGLTLGFQLLGSSIPVYGVAVCDSESYFNNKVVHDVKLWLARWGNRLSDITEEQLIGKLDVRTIAAYIGPGYAKGYSALFESIKVLAATEGVVLDPVYTGKAFHGLIQEIKQGRFEGVDDIVFVHTGGVFGLYPHKQEFGFD